MAACYKILHVAHRLLAHNDSLHCLHLGHVVIVGPQLPLLYPLVDPNQQVPGYILAIVYAWGGDGERGGF